MTKFVTCSQHNCDEVAVFSYVWPGKPDRTFACVDHMTAAKNVSDAMGFLLGDVRVVEHPLMEDDDDQ